MNPITIDVLVRTAEYELGLSAAFFVALVYGIPRLKAKADAMWPHLKLRWVHPNRIVNFFWPTKYLGIKGWHQEERPYHRYLKLWILNYYGQGFACLMIELVAALLATSVGLINHTNLPYSVYYFLFARANGAPNGAHIDSYLSVALLGVYAAWVTKDGWFGAAMTGFAYAIHEGLWLPLEYAAYLNYYLNTSVLINIARDLVFGGSILIVGLAFWKYPLRKIPMPRFKKPILIYMVFLGIWYYVPYLIGNYPFLPITTINNPILGLGVFQETPWYNDWLTNGFEVISWILLCASLAVSIYLWKRNRV